MKNLVSIILPTRKRFDVLLKSVKSLYDKATQQEHIELLLRFDEDDVESIRRVSELDNITKNYKYVIGDRLDGYYSLDVFVRELCEISTGEFLLLWNDDALMMSSGWDDYVSLYLGETCCIQMGNNHFPYIFPIISRDIFEVLGHFGGFPSDSWIHDVCKPLGVEIIEESIYAIHDRADVTGNNNDETYVESMNSGRLAGNRLLVDTTQIKDTAKEYYAEETQKLVKQDIEKLKAYLEYKQ